MSQQVKEKQVAMQNERYIDAGIGYIRWNSNNLQLIAIMEAIEEALKSTSPNEIARRIEG